MKLLLTVLFLPSIIAVEWPEAVGVAQSSATCTVDAADQAGSHDVLISKDDCIGLVAATDPFVNSNSACTSFTQEPYVFDFSFKIEVISDAPPCSDGASWAVIKPNGIDSCDGTLCSKIQYDGTLGDSVCGRYDLSEKEITLECQSTGVMKVTLANDWPIDIFPNFKGGTSGETVFVVSAGESVTGSTGANINNNNPFGISNVEFCGQCLEGSEGGEPTPAPTGSPTGGDGYVGGEPHFMTFGNEWFDFMGECDMKLISNPDFVDGLGLLVQIRTKIRYTYSYVEAAAIQIGDDVLEVASYGTYAWNGISNADLATATMGGFPVTYQHQGEYGHLFTIQVGTKEAILVKVYKDMVGVKFEHPTVKNFEKSVGVLGSFLSGEKLARDGTSIMTDANEYGQEWQVRAAEPQLFMVPSHVIGKCILPSDNLIAERKRRLGESVSMEAAYVACKKFVQKAAHEACVYDVMATGDIGAAEAGAF